MTEVYIALGSNLGDRLGNLRAAVRYLEEQGVRVKARSAVWETAPVPADQPSYLNAVVAGETDLGPRELLRELKAIERALGRRPSRRWGPRPADLDILFHGDSEVDSPELTLPHPRVTERAFVLVPLSEVAAGPLPVLGKGALELLAELALEQMSRYASL